MRYTVITGANGGIGRAVVSKLDDQNIPLILCDINFDNEVRKKYENSTIEFVIVDVSAPSSVEELITHIKENSFEIDGLVHLAGITRDRTLLNMSMEEWQQVIEVNLNAFYDMLKNLH